MTEEERYNRLSVQREAERAQTMPLGNRLQRERELISWTVGFQAGSRDSAARAAYWRRSAFGTWAVNVALSAVIAWLLWGGR